MRTVKVNNDARARLASYVEGFFPSTYEVLVTVYVLEGASAPIVKVMVVAPNKAVASHDAYQHEVLDVSYMTKVAAHLLQVVRTGLCMTRPQKLQWCRDSQVIPRAPSIHSAQYWRAPGKRAGLQKKRHL